MGRPWRRPFVSDEVMRLRSSAQTGSIAMRRTALWASMVLSAALSIWCLLVPYWHIHDPAHANRIVRSERRAIWRQRDPYASADITFTLVPAAAFAIVGIVLGFSLRDSGKVGPSATSPEEEPVLKNQ